MSETSKTRAFSESHKDTLSIPGQDIPRTSKSSQRARVKSRSAPSSPEKNRRTSVGPGLPPRMRIKRRASLVDLLPRDAPAVKRMEIKVHHHHHHHHHRRSSSVNSSRSSSRTSSKAASREVSRPTSPSVTSGMKRNGEPPSPFKDQFDISGSLDESFNHANVIHGSRSNTNLASLLDRQSELSRQNLPASPGSPAQSYIDPEFTMTPKSMKDMNDVTIVTDDQKDLENNDSNGETTFKESLMGYLVMTLLGTGIMFPWNAYITAYDYFHFLFPDQPMEFIMSIAFNTPQIIVLIVMFRWGSHLSYTSRIQTCFSVSFVCLAIVPFIGSMENRQLVFELFIASVVVCGFCVGVLLGALFSFAAQFPGSYTTALMSGIGFSGIIIAILRIATKIALPNTTNGITMAAYIYFCLSSFVILLCVVGYKYLIVTNPGSGGAAGKRNNTDGGSMIDEKSPLKPKVAVSYAAIEGHNSRLSHQGSVNGEYYYSDSDSDDQFDLDSDQESCTTTSTSISEGSYIEPDFWTVIHKIKFNAFAVSWTFFVTLSIFPGLTSLIRSTNEEWNTSGWFAIFLISTFLVGDFIGRTLPRWYPNIVPAKYYWWPVAIRTAFFPLFILCVRPKYFVHDAWAFGFMMAFAVSNGYLSSVGMGYGPMAVDLHERELAGSLMPFFYNSGIFIGVNFALLVLYMVTGSLSLS